MGNLQDVTVLVTRPQPKNQVLKQLILQQHGKVICLPLFAIESLVNKQWLQLAISHLRNCDLAIMVSRNAVELTLPYLSLQECNNICWATIGAATGNYLLSCGINTCFFPNSPPYNSDALVKTLKARNVRFNNARIKIFTGEDGDRQLKLLLEELGAAVEIIPVYKRIRPSLSATDKDLLLSLSKRVDIAVITCVTSLLNLYELAGSDKNLVNTLPLLVVSSRIACAALEMGFRNVYTSVGVSEAEIISGLIEWRQR